MRTFSRQPNQISPDVVGEIFRLPTLVEVLRLKSTGELFIRLRQAKKNSTGDLTDLKTKPCTCGPAQMHINFTQYKN